MKKKPLNKLDKYLIFSVTVLIIYTIIEQILSVKVGVERSTLTTCFYAAFGGEILSCVVIKVFNIKNEDSSEDEEIVPPAPEEDAIEFVELSEDEP